MTGNSPSHASHPICWSIVGHTQRDLHARDTSAPPDEGSARSQLSFVEIQKALHLVGQLLAKRFYIFGKPIAHSMSPTARHHGATRRAHSRSQGHQSRQHRDPVHECGGHRGLLGDNTDWIRISHRSVIKAMLPPSLNNVDSCLVLDAGGTARAAIYALHTLGASRIYLFNGARKNSSTRFWALITSCSTRST